MPLTPEKWPVRPAAWPQRTINARQKVQVVPVPPFVVVVEDEPQVRATLHWHFSSRGRFPALPTDTPEVVRRRLCGLLERTAARFRSTLLPGVAADIRLTTRGSRPTTTPDT